MTTPFRDWDDWRGVDAPLARAVRPPMATTITMPNTNAGFMTGSKEPLSSGNSGDGIGGVVMRANARVQTRLQELIAGRFSATIILKTMK